MTEPQTSGTDWPNGAVDTSASGDREDTPASGDGDDTAVSGASGAVPASGERHDRPASGAPGDDPEAADGQVTAALVELDAAAGWPPADQVAVFATAHETLQATLARIDDH